MDIIFTRNSMSKYDTVSCFRVNLSVNKNATLKGSIIEGDGDFVAIF